MNKYFDEPKQVIFADPDNEGAWLVGIAYKDEIICACCGGVFEITDVIKCGPEGIDPIWEYNMWNDIVDEIKGDEPPEGFAEATGLDIAMMNADEYESEAFYGEDDAIGFGDRVDEEESEFETYSHFSFDVD